MLNPNLLSDLLPDHSRNTSSWGKYGFEPDLIRSIHTYAVSTPLTVYLGLVVMSNLETNMIDY